MPVLICDNVYRTFPDSGKGQEVLKGVSFTVNRGEVVGIIGPSGSGKSTLLHLAGGLDRPSSGRIRFRECDIDKMIDLPPQAGSVKGLSFVFQNHYLLKELNVIENEALPGFIRGKAEWDRAASLLGKVGLNQRAKAGIDTLSGGESQRVAVARALYLKPRLIIADEPTGSLDKHNAQLVFKTLLELAQSSGSSIIIATHNQRLVNEIPRILELVDGKLIEA